MQQTASTLHLPRFFAAFLLAVAVSLFVFWAMQTLIATTKSVVDETESIAINFIHVEKKDDINTKERKVSRPPPPPKEPPKPQLNQQQKISPQKQNMEGIDFSAADVDMQLGSGLNGVSTSDGDYLPIIKVAPIYPRSAAQRGIEGFVVLEFTVNELGAVVDPVVINAEPPGIFDRAAIDAAKKFKYKPKMVDGKAQAVSGVKNLIRFQLEKSE